MSCLRKTIVIVLVVASLGGCGVQDSTQPPENSISAPKKDAPLIKTKQSVPPGSPTKKP